MKPETIIITNFKGSLTRYENGDLNSGLTKFDHSFGYDPFSKPGSLTWLYQPDNIAGTVITDAVLAGKIWSLDSTARYVYSVGNAGNLYRIDPTQSGSADNPLFDTPSVIGNIPSVITTFNYGGSLDFYNNAISITGDNRWVRTNFGGSVIGSASITAALFHPQIEFAGKLYIGNANNLVEIDGTNTVTNGAKLSPPLPAGMYIRDLDVTPDSTYMVITASYLYPENISAPNGASDRGNPYAVDSEIFYWNGVDAGVTAAEVLPSFPAASLNTFLGSRYTFNNDAFGGALYEGNQKLITTPKNLAPMPYGSAANGGFLTWAVPEVTGEVNAADPNADASFSSLYYYGYLDQENEPGLWRMFRHAPDDDNTTSWRIPLNLMINNYSFTRKAVAGWGKQYISVFEYSSATGNVYKFLRFVLPPAANTAPVLGTWETQNQLFSKRSAIKQIRVYCDPTVANNSFRVSLVGPNSVVLDSKEYTYAAGTDETLLEGAQERIDFNPTAAPGYSFGIRIENLGTTNMVFNKVELDWSPQGK